MKDRDEVKRTNEIKMAIPLLEAIDIEGKDVSADALLTQRKFARYLVEKRKAHDYFTIKGNQPGLLRDLELYFHDRGQPHFVGQTPPDHGRIETRKIWITTELNGYLDFPHVGQAYLVERQRTEKKTGQTSCELAYGLTTRPPHEASPERVLKANRGQWTIEGCHYILDWNDDVQNGSRPESRHNLVPKFTHSVACPGGNRNGTHALKFRRRVDPIRWPAMKDNA